MSGSRPSVEKNLESCKHKGMGTITTSTSTSQWLDTALGNSNLIYELVMYNCTMYMLMKLS